MSRSKKYAFYETERLYLRPTNEEDAAFILALFTTKGALRFIGDRNLHTPEDALSFIQNRTLKQLREKGFGNCTLVEKATGTKVGACGLYHRPGLENVDLGYAMLPEFEGKGYATEASLCMMDAAKHDFGLTVLDAITHPENERSMGLLRKLGFAALGQIKIEGYDGPSELFRKEL
jgi:RimJ/RimL family protein N-acetyltransferase